MATAMVVAEAVAASAGTKTIVATEMVGGTDKKSTKSSIGRNSGSNDDGDGDGDGDGNINNNENSMDGNDSKDNKGSDGNSNGGGVPAQQTTIN
jgi:hypothetical protein